MSTLTQLPPEHHFDFWLGRWEVRWGDDQRGTNHVTRILDGRVIQENFDGRPALPFQGMSLSVYSPKFGQWQQTWVDTDGNYWHFRGGLEGEQMILATDDLLNGQPVKLRMVFYNLAHDAFDWRWERSNDGGQTWELKWAIHYQRQAGGDSLIRPVHMQDWAVVRDLTLQLLTDSPHAFGEPLADAQARPEAAWRQITAHLADLPRACAFIAEDATGVCGFVRGDSTEPRLPPGAVLAGQLWVAPRQRGTGLGQRLMAAVTNWAITFGADQLVLGVIETNLSVIKFYEHLGYAELGLRIPLPSDPTKAIIIMGRNLKP